jgi:hypothetical protein
VVSIVWLRARRAWRCWCVVSQLRILIICPLAIILRKEVIVIVIVPVVIPLETTREIVHATLIKPFILACVVIIALIAETIL